MMDEAFETDEVASLTVHLCYDPEPYVSNPREWDNVGQLFGYGDFPTDDERNRVSDDYGQALREYAAEAAAEGGIVLAVRFDDYGSSGQRIHTVSSIDDANGLCVVPGAVIAEDWVPIYATVSEARERALACAEAELDTFNAYLQGEVFGYVVKAPNGATLDSCWGFVGEGDYIREEAHASAKAEAESIEVALESPDLRRALPAARLMAEVTA